MTERLGIARCFMAVDNEAEMLCHLIVQRSAWRIRCLSLPIDAAGTSGLGLVIDRVDEGFANALTTTVRLSEEILQVAYRLDSCGASME